MTPWGDRIVNVFDGGLLRINDASEIHVLVDGRDEREMPCCLVNQAVAVGNIERQYARQFLIELHMNMMALD